MNQNDYHSSKPELLLTNLHLELNNSNKLQPIHTLFFIIVYFATSWFIFKRRRSGYIIFAETPHHHILKRKINKGTRNNKEEILLCGNFEHIRARILYY